MAKNAHQIVFAKLKITLGVFILHLNNPIINLICLNVDKIRKLFNMKIIVKTANGR